MVEESRRREEELWGPKTRMNKQIVMRVSCHARPGFHRNSHICTTLPALLRLGALSISFPHLDHYAYALCQVNGPLSWKSNSKSCRRICMPVVERCLLESLLL
jgi:hypothetical protein